jgi:hypothetical protein
MIEARTQLQIHSAHIALFGVWVVIFAVVYARERLKGKRAGENHPTPARLVNRLLGWPGAIGACSVVAGAVHLSIIRDHFREAVLYGLFFLLLTVAQFGFAAWVIWRPGAGLFKAGAVASLAVVLLWLATRTTGIPLGPAAGETEPFGALDIVASAAELVTAALCLLALRSRPAGARGGHARSGHLLAR